MATVIDHLILELDLDPKAFDESKKKAAAAFLSMQQKAEEMKQKVAEPASQLSLMLDKASNKIGLFVKAWIGLKAVVTAGNMMAQAAQAGMEIGKLSVITGVSVKTLSLWENTAERLGGKGSKMLGAIQAVNNELIQFNRGGGMPNLATAIATLNKEGANIKLLTDEGRTRAATDYIEDIVAAIDSLKIPRDNRTQILRSIGLDDESIFVFSKGIKVWRQAVEEQKNIFQLTEKDVEASYRLNAAWQALAQTAKKFGVILVNEVEPALTAIIEKLIKKNDLEKGTGVIAGTANTVGNTVSLLRQGRYWDALKNEFGFPPSGSGGSSGATAAGDRGGSASPAPRTPDGKYRVPTGAQMPSGIMGLTQTQWDAYRQGLANIESSGGNYGLAGGAGGNYDGAYQFGRDAKSDVERVRGQRTPPRSAFRANSDLQEEYLRIFTELNHKRLMRNPKYAAMPMEEKLKILGYAHNQGAGGGNQYLNTGVVKSDAFGTRADKYGASVEQQLQKQQAQAIPWMSNPSMLRAPRFNRAMDITNDYSTAETTVHSMIFNSPDKAKTDDAYGLGVDVTPTLKRNMTVIGSTEGPN